jgi:ACS family hexuronate transporter-like MFS transporter
MRRLHGIRWVTIALIMVGALVNFLSRQTLSIAAPTVINTLHISHEQYGAITALFQVGIIFQPLVGFVIDLMGVKPGFALFAFLWSVICMAHGLATSWQMLAGLRGMLGFAEGAFSPGGLKVVSEWFPARERGLAGGLYNIGPSLGSMVAPPLVAWAILNYSWQFSFVIVGLISLAWVAVWLLFYHPLARHPLVSAEEREMIVSGQESLVKEGAAKPDLVSAFTMILIGLTAASFFILSKAVAFALVGAAILLWIVLRLGFRKALENPLFFQRNFWGIALPRFLTDPTWGMLSFWVPLYLTQVRHFDLKQIAIYAWLPFLAADLGCIFGPAVVLFLQKRGLDLIDARRGAFTLGAILMIGVAFTGYVQNPLVAVALISLAGFAHQTLSVTMITMATDLFPRGEVGTVAGMAGTCANTGILIFTYELGHLVDTMGYSPAFVLLAALDIVAAIVAWTVIKKPAAHA